MDQRASAAALFNGVWELLDRTDRSPADDDRMLHMAHASRYHWGEVGRPVNLVRGEWQCSRVYAVLRRPEPALHHALRALALCRENGIGDFDLAFCLEALARAHAVAGNAAERDRWLAEARQAAGEVADADDRELVLQDLGTVPGA
jgi:hypothetical protein